MNKKIDSEKKLAVRKTTLKNLTMTTGIRAGLRAIISGCSTCTTQGSSCLETKTTH